MTCPPPHDGPPLVDGSGLIWLPLPPDGSRMAAPPLHNGIILAWQRDPLPDDGDPAAVIALHGAGGKIGRAELIAFVISVKGLRVLARDLAAIADEVDPAGRERA